MTTAPPAPRCCFSICSVDSSALSQKVFIIDSLYEERPYARFYVLETIARVPYFCAWHGRVSKKMSLITPCPHATAFTSILHLYESFGWWRRSDYLKIHFAQARSVTVLSFPSFPF